MKTLHTPGPWKYNFRSRYVRIISDTRQVATYDLSKDSESHEMDDEDHANAKLIAAAPDLLEALIAAESVLELCALESRYNTFDETWEQIKFAIKKATE